MNIKHIIKSLNSEIKWCIKHQQLFENIKDEEKLGFIKGLKQALLIVKGIEKQYKAKIKKEKIS